MCNDTELPIMVKVAKVVKEAKDTVTLVINYNLQSKPGQFIQIWLPRIEEKPFSISYQDKNKFGVTIQAVGPFSKKLIKLKAGDEIGIRGPYGNGIFNLEGKNIAIIGGGCGCAPTAFLADAAIKDNINVDYIAGSRNKDYILFENRFKKTKIKHHICTDDGSKGYKGFTTDYLEELLKKKKIDKIYTCGPEVMMKKILEIFAVL